MLQTGISLVIKFKGSLNAECAVRPPGSNVAAMPDDATAIAILFSFRTLARDGDAAPGAIAHICNEAPTHVALSTIAHICKLAPRSLRV